MSTCSDRLGEYLRVAFILAKEDIISSREKIEKREIISSCRPKHKENQSNKNWVPLLSNNKKITPGSENDLTDKWKPKKIRRSKIILQVLSKEEITRNQKCMLYIINL